MNFEKNKRPERNNRKVMPEILEARYCALHLVQNTLQKKLTYEQAQLAIKFDSFNLSSQERNFVKLIYQTVFRNWRFLTYVLLDYVKLKRTPKDETVKLILIIACAELFLIESQEYALVNSAVEMIKYYGYEDRISLVNGVLRQIGRDKAKFLTLLPEFKDEFPHCLAQDLERTYSDEQINLILKAHKVMAPLDLSIKELNLQEVKDQLAEFAPIVMPPSTIRLSGLKGKIDQLPGFEEGNWWVQDLAATLPIYLLDAKEYEGKKVFDLCAAPGGKSAQLACLAKHVYSFDISRNKVKMLQENIDRLKLENVTAMTIDVKKIEASDYGGQADIVLLDAPCSATGTIRRHPELPYIKTKLDIENLVETQTQMLETAAQLVKVGGSLIYCVCSLLESEGEQQIMKFLKKYDNFKLCIAPSFNRIIKEYHLMSLQENMVRTLPSLLPDQGGMDGFFMCRLDKIKD